MFLPKYDVVLENEIQQTNELTQVIIKYSGELAQAVGELGVTEILSENYAVIILNMENIPLLAQLKEVEYIERSKELFFTDQSSNTSSCIYTNKDYLSGNLSGEGVLLGVIDSGIDSSNSVLKNPDGSTKIKYIWDLGAEQGGTVPTGFNYGREYSSQDINEGKVFSNDTDGHGTAVAGIAASIAYNAQIIAVKLNNRNGFVRSTEIMRGIKYIIDKAVYLNMPVVINISYGTNDGSHDGSSLFETFIDSVADRWKTSVVVASGNEGNSAHHFYARISNDETVNVQFNVADYTNNIYLSLWKLFADKIKIRITSPDSQQSPFLTSNYSLNMGLSRINILFGEPTPYNGGSEIFISIKGNFIQKGIWTLEIMGKSIVEGNINIWLPVREGQSAETRFLNPDINTTLTLPSTALKVITVGGYNSVLDSVLSFSGRGYTRLYNVIKPDLTAPAYEIIAPAPNNSFVTATGTSFAAPHVTGAAALLMEWGIVRGNDPYMYGQRLKAYLQSGARRSENMTYPNKEWGFGRLCLEETLRQLQTLQVQTAEFNREINLESAEDKIYSDDFIDIAAEDEAAAFQLPISSNDYFVQVLENKYTILHIRRSAALETYGISVNNTLGFEPYLMGLMTVEQALIPALEKTGITRVQNQPNLNLKGRGVLVGIVDTGIDYRNSDFIYEDNTTKIAAVWDQTQRGKPPKGQYYGTEYTQDNINEALKSGEILPINDPYNHGTYLAQIVTAAAPDSQIIFVKLKEAKEYLKQVQSVPDNVPVYETTDLMAAVEYIFQKAREMNMPVSICMGLGTNQGGHKGYSVIERYLYEISSKIGVCVSVPMGNEAIAQHHAAFEISKDTYREAEISVGENNVGVPIWIWNYIADRVSVEIISPLGTVINRIQPQSGFANEYRLPLEGGSVYVEYKLPVILSQDQLTIVKLNSPVSGIWKIRLYGDSVLIGSVHLWMPAFTQTDTFFLNPDAQTTLTTPANAFGVIAVGGWNTADNSVYPPSGRGPTRLGNIKPTVAAPIVDMGTSVAAAVAAGAGALLLQWGVVEGNSVSMNTGEILSYVVGGAAKNSNVSYPDNVQGYGVLDLYESFKRLV